MDYNSDSKDKFIFITVIVGFIADLLALITTIGIPKISIGKTSFEIPKVIVSIGGIENIHLTFALMIYCVAAIIFVNIKVYLPNILLFASILIPQILLFFWFLAFYKTWYIVHVLLLAILSRSIICMYFIFTDNYLNSVLIHLILIPTQSLFLMCFGILSPYDSWGVVMLLTLFIDVPLVKMHLKNM